jgi:GATA-binding protein, other eukaryote
MPASFQPSFKHDILQVQNIQYDQPPYDDMRPDSHHGVNASVWAHSSPFASASPDMQNGSMLRELYSEPDLEQAMPQGHAQSHYHQYQNPATSDWALQQQQQQQYHHQPIHSQRSEFTSAPRRATFPYVRQDMESGPYHSPASYMPEPMASPYGSRVEPLYNDQIPLEERHYQPGHQPGPVYLSPHTGEARSIKIEEAMPPTGYYHGPVHSRPGSSHGLDCMNGAGLPFVSPHTGLPVQHTDDAASKETQYLRRRCFNCHTTEPPSWRRSTLNPGKIVCNKCGLYERTHLRARPLRFDELRAGNKGRKNSIVKGPVGVTGPSASGAPPPVPVPSETSPKQSSGKVKKEPREYPLNRRASVSSTTSSVHSATSDWDDNGKHFSVVIS